MKELRSATCQFSVEADIQHNLKCILKQIEQAADQKAAVVHFSECALSGYAGVDIHDIASLDWQELVRVYDLHSGVAGVVELDILRTDSQ